MATVDSIGSLGQIFSIYRASTAPTRTIAADGDANDVGGVTFRDAAVIINRADLGAQAVDDLLSAVADHVKTAQSPGWLLGTEDSRVNLQARARRLVDAIDETVRGAAWRGYNLLTSSAGRLRVEARSLGGTVAVPPQPMDAAALGLENLDFVSDEGLALAAASVALARAQVARAVVFLRNLDAALPDLDSFIRALAAAAEEVQARSAPRGSVIDLAA